MMSSRETIAAPENNGKLANVTVRHRLRMVESHFTQLLRGYHVVEDDNLCVSPHEPASRSDSFCTEYKKEIASVPHRLGRNTKILYRGRV